MYAKLGDHELEGFLAPSSQSQSEAMKYGSIPLVNEADAIQLTGRNPAEISVTLHIADYFCDPQEVIDGLRASARIGEVLPFIYGNGNFAGNFVINSIDIKPEHMGADGTIQSATISLSLLERASAGDPKPKGMAIKSQAPLPAAPLPPVPPPAEDITEDISKARGLANRIKKIAADVKKGTSEIKKEVKKVRKMAEDARDLYNTAKNKVEVTKNIIKRASKLPTSFDEAMAYASNLAALDDLADTSTLETGANNLSKSSADVTRNSAPVAAHSATREGGN